MQHVDYLAVSEKLIKQIKEGAFLTVQDGDDLNVMTIGWASVGFLWGRPILTVLVRNSRYTYEILERSSEFTVSVPSTDMKNALTYCGTHTGRHKHDKLLKAGLELFPSEKVKTPIIGIPGIHIECKIVYKSPIDPANLIESYKHLYPEKDYHTIYYGEILYSYSTDHTTKKKKLTKTVVTD